MPYAQFERFEIELSIDEARGASHQGRCDDDVAWLRRQDHVRAQLDAIPVDKLAAELREYGAWDDEELADDEANRSRIVWLAAGDILNEEHEANRDKGVGQCAETR